MCKPLTFVVAAALVVTAGCQRPHSLVVFHAASLARALDRVARGYQKEHRDLRVALEPSGSLVAARKISELGRRPDLIMLADAGIIERDLEPRHAAYALRFAGNRLVLAYGPHSRGAVRLTATGWPQVLVEEGVRLGCARADTAPIGYRTRWLWQLAAQHYAQGDLAQRLHARCARDLPVNDEGELLGLLNSRSVDYVFMYRSTVIEQHLQSLDLPAAIDLRATPADSGQAPPPNPRAIVYALSIPRQATRPELAEDFVSWMLAGPGRALLAASGFDLLQPARADHPGALPPRLRALLDERGAP